MRDAPLELLEELRLATERAFGPEVAKVHIPVQHLKPAP